MATPRGTLLLKDGTVFHGVPIGAPARAVGEVVFNTAMTGYPEVLTDASYRGQIVVMTYPLIGNYGLTGDDYESRVPFLSGFIVRHLSGMRSNYRATTDLAPYLAEHKIPALAELDTRALTRRLRSQGCILGIVDTTGATLEALTAELAAAPPIEGRDLVREVTCEAPYIVEPAAADEFVLTPLSRVERRFTVVDCGVKSNIVRALARTGARVTVVPATTGAKDILDGKPDGVVLSNGPGDPAGVPYVAEAARTLIGKVPILGICLGHQILGLALGGKTYKLKFGHHGGNHPVRDTAKDRVAITTQNHNYAVDQASLPAGVQATHLNLNDGTLEGFRYPAKKVLAVQFHPEAAPGPHDALDVFEEFLAMTGGRDSRAVVGGARESR